MKTEKETKFLWTISAGLVLLIAVIVCSVKEYPLNAQQTGPGYTLAPGTSITFVTNQNTLTINGAGGTGTGLNTNGLTIIGSNEYYFNTNFIFATGAGTTCAFLTNNLFTVDTGLVTAHGQMSLIDTGSPTIYYNSTDLGWVARASVTSGAVAVTSGNTAQTLNNATGPTIPTDSAGNFWFQFAGLAASHTYSVSASIHVIINAPGGVVVTPSFPQH
jgi:hypothetical protein